VWAAGRAPSSLSGQQHAGDRSHDGHKAKRATTARSPKVAGAKRFNTVRVKLWTMERRVTTCSTKTVSGITTRVSTSGAITERFSKDAKKNMYGFGWRGDAASEDEPMSYAIELPTGVRACVVALLVTFCVFGFWLVSSGSEGGSGADVPRPRRSPPATRRWCLAARARPAARRLA